VKVLIFIEHDIIIRHFIHSRIFEKLSEQHEVKFVFPETGYKRVNSDVSKLDLGAQFRHLTVHQKRLEMWKRLFIADSLRWRPGSKFKILRRLRRELIGPKASLLFTMFSFPGIFFLLREWTLFKIKFQPNDKLEALLDEERADVIIHPSILEGVYINDLVAVSHERKIPFVVIMNSWDNPSTKKAVLGNPDWLLVWGEQTKRHAVEFMGMPEEQVINFGVAQFDLYRKPARLSRLEFCNKHSIDHTAKIVLYAGSSKSTDEFQHLMNIDKAISAGKFDNVIVIYRPHPWGGGGKGGERILKQSWKNIHIEESMREYLEQICNGITNAINLPDYNYTHDVLSSIDALVSPLSTIIIEGALHDKPVLCFLPDEDTDAKHFTLAAPLIHFEDMYQMPEFLIAKGNMQLLPKLEELLAKTSNINHIRSLNEACKFFVEPFEQSYGDRLTEFIETKVRRCN